MEYIDDVCWKLPKPVLGKEVTNYSQISKNFGSCSSAMITESMSLIHSISAITNNAADINQLQLWYCFWQYASSHVQMCRHPCVNQDSKTTDTEYGVGKNRPILNPSTCDFKNANTALIPQGDKLGPIVCCAEEHLPNVSTGLHIPWERKRKQSSLCAGAWGLGNSPGALQKQEIWYLLQWFLNGFILEQIAFTWKGCWGSTSKITSCSLISISLWAWEGS